MNIKAYQGQQSHPAIENPHPALASAGGVADDDGKAHAEQQGEHRVELAVYEDAQQPPQHAVGPGRRHRGSRLRALEDIQ